MTTFGFSGPEPGLNVMLEFRGDQVIKTDQACMQEFEALRTSNLLDQYRGQLADTEVPVADVRDIAVISAEHAGDYRVRHTMDLIPGPCVLRLPPEERRHALRSVVGYLCTIPIDDSNGPATLSSPADAGLRNWHMNGDTPTLVDVYPPLSRDHRGRIAVYSKLSITRQRDIEEQLGQLGGIVPTLLLTTAPDLPRAALRDWCMDTLPSGMNPSLHRLLSREIKREVDVYVS